MKKNVWSGTKVRLRSVLPSDWEKRSEEGTRSWAEREASKAPNGDDNVNLASDLI